MHHNESMARRDKTRDGDNKAHTHTHMIHPYLPQVYQQIEMNFSKDVEILGAEISLANSVLVRIKSRVLTVSKMR